jgi:putative phosphoribosyl transferase
MTETAVTVGAHHLPGLLALDPGDRALVLFAHGSGSGRSSPRNREVAAVLRTHRLATLQFDMLDAEEALDRQRVFDIPLLARRLAEVIDWTRRHPATSALPLVLFGASTGAAAALVASALRPGRVQAIVARGGRPDLAGGALPAVTAPTLLIVGGTDLDVLDLNRQAVERMRAPVRLEVVPGASHLFSEPGKLERVATLAAHWFVDHLPDATPPVLRAAVPDAKSAGLVAQR